MRTLELYDETTDPEEHLVVYKTQTYVQDVNDATYCRYFPATLNGWRDPGLTAWVQRVSLVSMI